MFLNAQHGAFAAQHKIDGQMRSRLYGWPVGRAIFIPMAMKIGLHYLFGPYPFPRHRERRLIYRTYNVHIVLRLQSMVACGMHKLGARGADGPNTATLQFVLIYPRIHCGHRGWMRLRGTPTRHMGMDGYLFRTCTVQYTECRQLIYVIPVVPHQADEQHRGGEGAQGDRQGGDLGRPDSPGNRVTGQPGKQCRPWLDWQHQAEAGSAGWS